MSTYRSVAERIHARAIEISTRYKRAEAELIDILQQAEEHRVFLHRGYGSLFAYVVKELELSENTAYILITVARKARQVPELKTQLQKGAMTIGESEETSSEKGTMRCAREDQISRHTRHAASSGHTNQTGSDSGFDRPSGEPEGSTKMHPCFAGWHSLRSGTMGRSPS